MHHHNHQNRNRSRQADALSFEGPPAPSIPANETDPVFATSEAAQLEPGDKAKLDSALQPGAPVSQLTNDAGYLTAETDPAFAGSEAANLVPGDKAKIDSALQPGTDVEVGAVQAGSLTTPGNVEVGGTVFGAAMAF